MPDTEPRQVKGGELDNGVPPGKAVLWVVDKNNIPISGRLLYENWEQAVKDLAPKLSEDKGIMAVVNAKSEDGETLHVWTLKYRALPKRKAYSEEFDIFKPWTWLP